MMVFAKNKMPGRCCTPALSVAPSRQRARISVR